MIERGTEAISVLHMSGIGIIWTHQLGDISSSVSGVASASGPLGAYRTVSRGQISLEEVVDYRYHDEDKALYLKLVAQEARMRIPDFDEKVTHIKPLPSTGSVSTGKIGTRAEVEETPSPSEPRVRTFETGATRDTDEGKHDYRGYLSPLVLRRFGEYMTKHRTQSDGTVRASDNWKKGMPQQEYLSSALRHVGDVWLLHEGYDGVASQDIEEALCGLLFNIQGYLHSYLEENEWPTFTPMCPLPECDSVGGTTYERDEVPF